ncbi:hypothetical protein WBJ53_22625 [Spirosoma sp. SC4-14]|uniref:hypothetical protein n=1 Tax=Spirosoma sp. SC4-14 TaxID=3128900 RepID=UPI0030CD03B9
MIILMKLQLFFCLLVLSTMAKGQTEKGRGLLTGSVSLKVTSQYTSSTSIANPRITCYAPAVAIDRGVFVKDNWLVGGGLALSTSFNIYNPTNSTKSYDYNGSASAYIRRYWSANQFRLFLGGGLTGSLYHSHFQTQDVLSQSSSKLIGTNFSVKPFTEIGAMWPINNRLAVEASTQSTAFPFSFNWFGVGLTLMTGGVKPVSSAPAADAYQTQAGHWLLGGSLGLNNSLNENGTLSSTTSSRQTSFDFSPSIGKFVRKNRLIGVSIPFHISHSKEDGGKATYTQLGLAPYIKNYLTDGQLRPFIQGNLLFSTSWLKGSGNAQESVSRQTQSYGAGVSIGLAYMLGKRFIIEAELGGINAAYAPDKEFTSSWAINANATLSPTFTINYVLH